MTVIRCQNNPSRKKNVLTVKQLFTIHNITTKCWATRNPEDVNLAQNLLKPDVGVATVMAS